MILTYVVTLEEMYPGTQWSIVENDYETLEWMSDDVPKPTKEELDSLEQTALTKRAEKNVRRKRDELLTTLVDPIVSNPLRWNSLSQEKQQEVTTYRQALLDITQQPGFPHNVVWPEEIVV